MKLADKKQIDVRWFRPMLSDLRSLTDCLAYL